MLLPLLLLAPLQAAAQGSAASRPDPEVMNYRLSMEKLRKLVPAQRALNELNAKDPQFFEKIDRERQTGKKGPLTVAEQTKVLERYPAFKRALAGAGTTPREWLLISGAMGDALIAIEVKKGTLTSKAPPPTPAQKANIALLQKNDAEFQKIIEQLDQLTDEME
jgi:hypothetical protein